MASSAVLKVGRSSSESINQNLTDNNLATVALLVALVAGVIGVGTVSVMKHFGCSTLLSGVAGGCASFALCVIGNFIDTNGVKNARDIREPSRTGNSADIARADIARAGVQEEIDQEILDLKKAFDEEYREVIEALELFNANTHATVTQLFMYISTSQQQTNSGKITAGLKKVFKDVNINDETDSAVDEIRHFRKLLQAIVGNEPKPDWNEAIKSAYKEAFLTPGVAIASALKKMPKEFFDFKTHNEAKIRFKKVMKLFLGSEVTYPTPGVLRYLQEQGSIDSDLIHLKLSNGVQFEIPKAAEDNAIVHLFPIAGQANASEAGYPYTPAIGRAMGESLDDNTQGPLAQRTNPFIFELVLAFLTHCGFNMMQRVLPTAGLPYEKDSSIEHGYLCPSDDNISQLTEEMMSNANKAEYVCYPSQPPGAENPVYLMIQAAPCLDRGTARKLGKETNTDNLEKYATLANYAALFNQAIALAKGHHKPVRVHLAFIGGGEFGNKAENLAWGFNEAMLLKQSAMKAAQVDIQIDCLNRDSTISFKDGFCKALGIDTIPTASSEVVIIN